jgi:hypothetical protein
MEWPHSQQKLKALACVRAAWRDFGLRYFKGGAVMKKILFFTFFALFMMSCATIPPAEKTWKVVVLDCVTPASWNVPDIFPEDLDVPDYFQPLLGPYVCSGYRDKNGDWYYILLKFNEDTIGICQGEVVGFETARGPVNNIEKRFWKTVDNKPVEITFKEYEQFLYGLFDEVAPPETPSDLTKS